MNNQANFPLNIKIEDVPNDTYFRVADVLPVVNDGNLTITDGRGSWHRWGTPSCDSLVYLVNDAIIAVHVTGWHKHTVSPVGGWYYFIQNAAGSWKRVTANKKEVKAIKHLLPAYGRFVADIPANIVRFH